MKQKKQRASEQSFRPEIETDLIFPFKVYSEKIIYMNLLDFLLSHVFLGYRFLHFWFL